MASPRQNARLRCQRGEASPPRKLLTAARPMVITHASPSPSTLLPPPSLCFPPTPSDYFHLTEPVEIWDETGGRSWGSRREADDAGRDGELSGMDGHGAHGGGGASGGKLTRTPSSLLRSPTVRSGASFQQAFDVDPEPDDKKVQGGKHRALLRPAHHRLRPRQAQSMLLLVVALPLLALVVLVLRRDGRHLVLLAAAAAGSTLAVARLRRVRRRSSSALPASVQWFIGEGGDERQSKGKVKADGRVVREGVEFYSNGDCYEGEFYRGRCSGSGVYNFFGKGKYEGDWVDGKYDGYGVESWARGSRYRGQYRQGLRHGHGVYRFFSGDCYAGEWAGGQSHGLGAQTCSDGSSYAGEFKGGVKHGIGCYHFRNGDRYSGEYFADKIHGFGVYSFANGHCYGGSWHEGKKEGFGMYTFRNGDKRSGEWGSGTLRNPLPLSNPSVQRAVLAAQRAADSAFHLPRIDEQVNKVVMAANRAATAARVAAIKAVQNRIDGKLCEIDV